MQGQFEKDQNISSVLNYSGIDADRYCAEFASC